MNNHLFVYGTLLHDIQSMIANHLKTHSRLLGAGQVRGRLYDLGRYPGLVHEPASEQLVYGQVYQLEETESILKTLDKYEGITNDHMVQSEYVRSLIAAQMEDRKIYCWCYLYAGDTSSLTLIESGNYLEYLKDNPNHQGFIDSV